MEDGLLDTTSLWKGHLRGLATSDNEDIAQSCGKGVALGILHGDNGKRTFVLFNVHKSTYSTTTVSLGDHDHGTQIELDKIRGLTGSDDDLDGIIDLDEWIWVTDSTSIMSNSKRNSLLSELDLLDFAELVLRFLFSDSVDSKSSLDVVDESKMFTSLFNGNNI